MSIAKATEIAARFGMIDGAHHKQWVIDQMLRAVLGDGYDAWRKAEDQDCASSGYPLWDEGTPP